MNAVKVGNLTLEPSSAVLRSSRGRIDLGQDVARVAARLMTTPNKPVLTSDLITTMATSDELGPDSRLRTCIGRIGIALVLLADSRPRIRRCVGGYMLEAAVR